MGKLCKNEIKLHVNLNFVLYILFCFWAKQEGKVKGCSQLSYWLYWLQIRKVAASVL